MNPLVLLAIGGVAAIAVGLIADFTDKWDSFLMSWLFVGAVSLCGASLGVIVGTAIR